MSVIFSGVLLMLLGSGILMIKNRNIFGGLIFTAGLIIGLIGLVVFVIEIVGEHFIYGDLISSLTVIFIFFTTVFYLFYNSKIMTTKEGRSTTAKLSLIFGTNLLISVLGFLFLFSYGNTGSTFYYSIIYSIFLPFFFIDLIFILLFIFYLFYSWMYQKIPINKKIDYIVVLGSGVNSEDVPPLLKSRLDKAIEYFLKNPQAKLVVSGGKGSDEPVSEAFAMKRYLLSQNISEKSILTEENSTSTLENMMFSKAVIEKDWDNESEKKQKTPFIIFTTNNYHVLRASIYARQIKLKIEGVGAPTALYFLPSALIREFIALIVHNKKIVLWGLGLLIFIFFLISH